MVVETLWADLELWLHQGQKTGGIQPRIFRRGNDEREGDEGNVDHHEIKASRGNGRCDGVDPSLVPGVDVLESLHSRVVAEGAVQLTLTDVDPGDGGGALLQEAVGETARALADIETSKTGHIQSPVRERGLKLKAGPGDEAVERGVGDEELVTGKYEGARGRDREALPVPPNVDGAAFNQVFGVGARTREAKPRERKIATERLA